MDAKNLIEAKKNCLNDQSCDMFYRVCHSSRFRKCNNSAKAEYEEPSTCGDILGPSDLYKRGNIYKTYYFQQLIEYNGSILIFHKSLTYILRFQMKYVFQVK